MSTGQKQRELAEIIARYATELSHGELRAAIRWGAPGALEGKCVLCDTGFKLYCPNCQGNSHEK